MMQLNKSIIKRILNDHKMILQEERIIVWKKFALTIKLMKKFAEFGVRIQNRQHVNESPQLNVLLQFSK